jgi:hypothetical protein
MMFKAIKEFFVGKPVVATPVVEEVPYKVEAPVNPQITDAVTQSTPVATTPKKKPAPKVQAAKPARPAKTSKPAPAKKPTAPKKPAPAKKK